MSNYNIDKITVRRSNKQILNWEPASHNDWVNFELVNSRVEELFIQAGLNFDDYKGLYFGAISNNIGKLEIKVDYNSNIEPPESVYNYLNDIDVEHIMEEVK